LEFDVVVKVETYRRTAETGHPPVAGEVAQRLGVASDEVREAFARLAARRLLVLEPDGATIRMAPPFSGVPTQHRVRVEGLEYFANCAWDALAIPAALHREGKVESRCEQSGAPLRLCVGLDGPEPSDWLFHCEVPAARWWQDIVYT
jgi:hypothetical protein